MTSFVFRIYFGIVIYNLAAFFFFFCEQAVPVQVLTLILCPKNTVGPGPFTGKVGQGLVAQFFWLYLTCIGYGIVHV